MSKIYLGEFEELTLTMVIYLQSDAYGNTIVNAIKEHQERKVSLSAVHITLYRLEEKGFLSSYMGGATKERGGRKKRYFEITNAGLEVVKEMKNTRQRLWDLVPQLNH